MKLLLLVKKVWEMGNLKLIQGLLLMMFLISCNEKSEKTLFEQQENWGESFAGDTTSIHFKLKAIKSGKDTIYQITHYYPNGIEKTKTVMVNDRLNSIIYVNDTLGNPYDYGKLENGSGYVKQYDYQGTLTNAGSYLNGNRNGWWYRYSFKGELIDSILYKEGYAIDLKDTTWIDELFGHISLWKNNYYD